ncbi:hypothetical protein CSC81_04285 [Tenacibaculum discolor]|uniref:Phage abortive infection protein n=1 Tax=Tenacibaculum discolor TaxID=361581 RepID=A0A2G1BXW1_9FLAO|nr:hypothetical protein [Tenacibaculum discolor]MDP2540766.1 hypothetical protein [Tenacibaculum discolor]PHN98719.1 hypothetical protein CSC81_04285 [Tenacibaculum discolor]
MELTKKKVVFGVLLVLLIWVLSAVIMVFLYDIPSDRGATGDMFGAVNALFSGLALFGIVVSILIQQKELRHQKEELSDTRKEFKVNRVTNILFKQAEYLNLSIERNKYKVPTVFENNWESVDFDSFVRYIENPENVKRIKTLHVNSNLITFIIAQLVQAIDNFENILDLNSFDREEKKQMRFLFGANLNPRLFPLLRIQLKLLKRAISDVVERDETSILENELRKIDLRNIKKILVFVKKNKSDK